MSEPKIVVEIVGDADKFKKATGEASQEAGRFSKSAVKGFGLGVGLGAFSLATGAIDTMIGSLGEAQQAFKDDQVSANKLANTLKNVVPGWDGNTAAIEKYAEAQGRLGFEDDEVRDSIGQLVGITHDVAKAQELSALAQDLARAKGIDLATATDIVTKAAQGNGKALKGLGIDVAGVTDAAGFLDAMQKNVKGSAEEWAKTSEGKAAVANVKNAESMEKIGAVVDRVATAVLPIAADAFSAVADVVLGVADAVGPLVATLVKELQPAFSTVMSFVQSTVFPILRTLADVYLKYVATVIGIVVTAFKTAWPLISGIVKVAADVIGTYIGIVTTVIKTVATTVLAVAKTVGDAVKNIVGFFTGIGGKIGNATKGMWDGIWNAFRSVLNTIIRGWNSIKFTLPEVDLGPLGKVGGFTIGTPNLPLFHTGGVVPGHHNEDVPIMAKAGERISREGQGSGGVHIHVGTFVGSDASAADALGDLLVARLRARGAF